MPRILHAAETIKGGVGVHLEEILPRQIDALGEESVRVLIPRDERPLFPGIPDGIVVPFDRPGNRIANTMALARAIATERKRFRPDVIHAHSTFAGAAARLPALVRRNRAAIVYCPHGWSFAADGPGLRRHAFAALERIMARASDAIITVSRHERDLAASLGVDPGRMHVLRNGIADTPSATPFAEGFASDRWNLVFVGRLDRQKGFDILVDAARRIGASAHIHVIGVAVRNDGGDIGDLPGNITLHGWQPRPVAASFIAAADAVLMPSRWEGLPLVALEAMRAGKPVLASDRSAMPEIVEDRVTGRLVPIDDGQPLADAIVELNRDDLVRWGQAGRRRYERDFTIERQADAILSLYDRVIGSRNRTNGAS